MTAFVESQRLYQWVCDECLESGPLTLVEADADRGGDLHDSIAHDPHDRDDDA